MRQSKRSKLVDALSRIERARRDIERGELELQALGFDERSANIKVEELKKLEEALAEWTDGDQD